MEKTLTTEASVFSLLDKEARRWWYHAQLRAMGQDGEARRRERDSILSDVATLRAARETGFCTVYDGRVSFDYDQYGYNCNRSGCSFADAQAAVRAGVPLLDLRGVEWGDRSKLPMLNNGRPDPISASRPVTSCTYVTREVYLSIARDLPGIVIHNDPGV